jgi:glycosyltransferase involved in cell wall biosynthesis
VFRNTKRKFYFIQDDEAQFYPAGSTSALVEATYQFGYTGICNTPSLLERYVARGGEGAFFVPCIDPAVFHAQGRVEDMGGPFTLFCYGRPHHPRNGFELLAATVRRLKERLGDRIRIVTAGDDWDPHAYGLDGVVHNVGLLNYRSTGALYRACDAGLVLMMTRHPSYLPMELMACGALVVTNENPDTRWLVKDEENCLLAAPTPASVAERVESGLTDEARRRRIVARASEMVASEYSDWEKPIEEMYTYMLSRC